MGLKDFRPFPVYPQLRLGRPLRLLTVPSLSTELSNAWMGLHDFLLPPICPQNWTSPGSVCMISDCSLSLHRAEQRLGISARLLTVPYLFTALNYAWVGPHNFCSLSVHNTRQRLVGSPRLLTAPSLSKVLNNSWVSLHDY